MPQRHGENRQVWRVDRKTLPEIYAIPPSLQVEGVRKSRCCTPPANHKGADVPNRLVNESSLYLRQHKDNPVDWWPWCPEAFAEARAKDKPVLVSVGYSSCHWCHVMAHESFEQEYCASLMNQHFICIKVDREERPEVDKLMMDAVQMVHGHGGWPLNCFCLPDGRPFFGGTYFPPDDRGHGQVPWPQLLMRVADFYHRNKTDLSANADAIAQNLTHLTRAPDADGSSPSPEDLIAAARRICEQHDDTHGGFGSAPKFPSPSTLSFLLAIRATAAADADRSLATRLDAVITVTLGAMARGGLYDQIGGGFHRYCVDRDWTVPHFEKMLYDNAQLLGLYAEAWARYRNPLYARICEETLAWLERDMRLPNGLFAASLDADTGHHEGTTYLWKSAEIAETLGPEALPFAQAYGITDQGNFEGSNIPKCRGHFNERERLAEARAKLLQVRQQRPQPARDDKALLSWNALLVNHLAKAAWIFGRNDWFNTAAKIEQSLWDYFAKQDGNNFSLLTVAHGTIASQAANLSDYAWLAEAELNLAAYAAWGAPHGASSYQARAEIILRQAMEDFSDPHAVGYFLVTNQRTDLSVRQKDWFDNAVPAGNSSLLHGFSALHALTGEPLWTHEFNQLTQAFGGTCRNVPNGIAHALDALTRSATGLVIIKAPPEANWTALQKALNGDATIPAHQRAFRACHLQPTVGTHGFQVCIGPVCQPGVADAQEVSALV